MSNEQALREAAQKLVEAPIHTQDLWDDLRYALALPTAALPRIRIPTDAMDQEFQNHYRRGFEAGKCAALPTADHIPDAGEKVVDQVPYVGKMIETAAPVGELEAFEDLIEEFEAAAIDKHDCRNPEYEFEHRAYDTACQRYDTARAALSAGYAGWQPIETAPKDGRLGLVYRPLAANTRDEPIAIKSLIGGDRFCWPHTVPKGSAPTNPTDGACHVTHWMPLPPPPSAIRARGEAAK